MCVCVCVCEREREETDRQRKRENKLWKRGNYLARMLYSLLDNTSEKYSKKTTMELSSGV